MDELTEFEIQVQRHNGCVGCSNEHNNCPDSHVLLCMRMDAAESIWNEDHYYSD